MKKLFISTPILISLTLYVNAQVLSPKSEISIITLGPSQSELYSAFGHSAFRVSDPENNWDLVFNYGVFDFNQANFYLNFVMGNPYYKLALESWDHFLNVAIEDNRGVVEQILNLNQDEKQKLFDFLLWNAQPENSSYYYNYIYNNCATKIRDVMDSVFNNKIVYDFSYVNKDLSFRDLMDLYLDEQPWGDFGINLCLGTGVDKAASGFHWKTCGASQPGDDTVIKIMSFVNILK
jgi:hypothetical protein